MSSGKLVLEVISILNQADKSDMYIAPKCSQLEKAAAAIDVTLGGIVTESILVQCENALFPIDVTVFGIVTELMWELY